MTLPVLMTAMAGTKVSASAFNAGVRDPLSFLLDPPRCEVTMATNIGLAAGTSTVVGWDSEISDNDGMHSTVSLLSRIVFQTAGRYEINIATCLTSTTVGTYDLNLRLNAAGSSAGGSSIRTWPFGVGGGANTARQQAVSFTRTFNAADYVELFVALGTAGTLQGGNGILCTGMQVQFRSLT